MGWGIAVAVVSLIVVFGALFHRLISRVRAANRVAEHPDSVLLASYAPMGRLLSEKDFEFLTAHPGYHPEIVRRLRIQHRDVLAAYLRSATRDFRQLHALAKQMLVSSGEDQPDFAQALRREHLTFCYAVTIVRCRLLLMPFGVGAPDIGGLIRPLESLRIHLAEMVSPSE
ncbi:MAG TPA: hypothetical protein VIX89_10800 [Bryobacteraceae bacterium]